MELSEEKFIMVLSPKRYITTLLVSLLATLTVMNSSADAANTVVRFETDLGDIHVRMLDVDAQNTVDNFLLYVNNDIYDRSIFHRLHFSTDNNPASPTYGDPALEVLQGGGFTYYSDVKAFPLDTYPDIADDYGRPNVRGTIAMAKSSAPNSTSSQFFFNLNDVNVGVLDPPDNNGGFMVFGYVIGDSMDVVEMLSGITSAPYGNVVLEDHRGYLETTYIPYWDVEGNPNLNGYNPYSGAFGELPLIPTANGYDLEWLRDVSVVGLDGDADFDGDVDIDDYNVLLSSFGLHEVGLAADFDGDYDVDLQDFSILRANFGDTSLAPLPEPGSATPEPASMCILGLGAMAIIRKRRRKA